MARADYDEQLRRHAGHWDVLPCGLPLPSLQTVSHGETSAYQGTVELTDAVLEGNRWPAVSGAMLAEVACRCATVAMLARSEQPVIREISVRFRKAIPVAEPRTRPHVADGVTLLEWTAIVEADVTVVVAMSRRLPSSPEPVVTVEARARFDAASPANVDAAVVDARIARYLASLPRRLALPAYEPGWSDTEIRGVCMEPPGSLVGAAEEALGDAGKIVRGNGVPDELDVSMLLADMTYRWLEPVHDGPATYVARAGESRTDEKGRTWVAATATMSIDGRAVGEAAGSVVFKSFPRR